VLNPALFDSSGFLAANIMSYMDTPSVEMPFPDTPAPLEEFPRRERFSEFLAALERPAEAENDAPVRDEPHDVETAALDAAEAVAAAENMSVRDIQAAAQTAVKPDDEAAVAASGITEAARPGAVSGGVAEGAAAVNEAAAVTDGTAAEFVKAANLETPLEELAPEAAPLADGQDKPVRQQAGAGRNGAESKVPPASGDAKNTEIPALDADNGVYVDENARMVEERLAALNEKSPAKTAVRSSGLDADGLAAGGGTEDAGTQAPYLSAAENIAAALNVKKEKETGVSSASGKKSPAERGRRQDERRGLSATDGKPMTQPSETFEARRVSSGGPAEAESAVNLRGGARNAPADGRGDGAKPAASFENFLVRELQQNLNGSIVRQAQVMLREGGEGTIRLSLKPESLGKVKIHLEMAENKITGKIVVESGEALRAFEHEMRSLEQTFRGEGFDGASLSLELDERDERQNGENWQQGGERNATRTASSRYGETAAVAFFGASCSAKQVNVLV
jgi:flagellar hook-length control protein FliK